MFLKLLRINIYTFIIHLSYVVYNYITWDWTTYTSLIYLLNPWISPKMTTSLTFFSKVIIKDYIIPRWKVGLNRYTKERSSPNACNIIINKNNPKESSRKTISIILLAPQICCTPGWFPHKTKQELGTLRTATTINHDWNMKLRTELHTSQKDKLLSQTISSLYSLNIIPKYETSYESIM